LEIGWWVVVGSTSQIEVWHDLRGFGGPTDT